MSSVRVLVGLVSALVFGTGCAGLPAFQDSSGLLSDRPAAESGQFLRRASKKQAEAQFIQQLARARGMERAAKLAEARHQYEQLLREFPERHEPYHRLAVVADRQRRHTEAQELYARAIEMRPTDAELFNDLGYCFFLQGQLDKSASALQKAVTLAPNETRYHNNLGLVWGQQGRREEALGAFRRAGSEADAQYNLAFIFASQNENEAAKACFQRALAADPTHSLSKDALAAFERYENGALGLSHFPVAENGRRYVPYVESAPSQDNSAADSDAQMVSHNAAIGTYDSAKSSHWNWLGTHSQPGAGGSSVVPASYHELADPQTQVLQQRAHSMLVERLGPRP